MRILVTGHRGFIGGHVVAALTDHEVTTHDWGEPEPDIRGFDWVIHLGANSSTTESNIELIMQQNLDSSIAWLNECIRHGVNLQFASSAGVYGRGNHGFQEDAPADPRTPYAWTKYLFERHVQQVAPKNIRVQMFRYFNVYGTGEDHKGGQASPYNQFRHQAHHTGIINIFEGSENAIRDFVPVAQVIDTHLRFLEIPESGIWNIGTGESRSFLAVAEEIAQKTGAKIRTIPMPEHIRRNYQWYTCADMTKTQATLNQGDKPCGPSSS